MKIKLFFGFVCDFPELYTDNSIENLIIYVKREPGNVMKYI